MSDDDTGTDAEGTEETTDTDGTEQLGDAGKKALDAMKTKWQAERDGAKPWKTLARELGVKSPDELKALLASKQSDDNEAEADRIRREATAEVTAKANARIVRAEVKALAGGKFADPADAALYLNLDEFEVDEDGEVDGDAITAALDELLKKKPHLAAQGGRRFAGGGDGGHRGDAKPNVAPGMARLAHAYATTSKTT
ncbi:MAG: hypothetical protein ABW156_05835 [Jiangellaceae bacterium]